MESLRPTVCTVSAGAGEQDPSRRKPIGLVLDLRTTVDLGEPCRFVPELAVDVRFCSMR